MPSEQYRVTATVRLRFLALVPVSLIAFMEAFVRHMHDGKDGKDIKVAAVLSLQLGTQMVSLATLATDGVAGMTDGS